MTARAILIFLATAVPAFAHAELCSVQAEIRGTIGPATTDLLKRVQDMAARDSCASIILLVNTPGGSLETTRTAVEMILNSKIPYLCLVAPSGGHAGSAGAIILQACHVNGALHGTNLGAATPVTLGQEMPKDLREKILNDTRSWLESITKLRKRSDQFGRDIVVDAKAVSAEEAYKLKAVDFVGDGTLEFLRWAQGRSVTVADNKVAEVGVGRVVEFPLDTRYTLLSLLTDPEFAYLLLLGSLALLYFEFTHPGAVAPGVAGALGLVISMMAMNKLQVEWGGLILIFIGVGLLVAELFLPTFGIVGVGGIIALFLGSVFLFDPVKTGGYRLPVTLVAPGVLAFGIFFTVVSYLVYRTRLVKKKGGFEDLLGTQGRVVKLEIDTHQRGLVELRGETWKFESPQILNLNDAVVVRGFRGLVLQVAKEE